MEKLDPPYNCSSELAGLEKLGAPSFHALTVQHRGEQNNVYLKFLNYKLDVK